MRSRRFQVILAIALAVAPAATLARPAAAQSNAARIANDHYTRSHDYDLVHQRIVLSDFDWDSTSFTGTVTTTLVARRDGMDSLILDAGALLDIQRVRDAKGAALRFGRQGDTMVVRLPRAAAFGDTLAFTIDYDARVKNGSGLTFIQPEGRPHRPQQIWSQGEDMNNHDWFPTYDFPNDKMTWEMDVTVPAKYTAVSNGKLVSDTRKKSGDRRMRWRQDEPSATYLVSLVVAPLAKITDSWHGVPVTYYVYHEDSALARPLFRVTPDMIDTYSRLTGVPYPWAKYAQTTVADFFGGMENVSATTLVDWLPDARAYRDRPWYQHILIPHELAHQWFGDYVTTENWANMWLNEGYAEFMPGQYWAQKLGAHAEQDYYLDEYHQFMAIDRRRRMPLASSGSNNIYPKGALVLEMLKHYLGEDRFWASVHRYLVDHAHDNATTDDMRQAVLDATGENLSWFWAEWLYRAGYPEFSVAANYDSAARTLRLTVKQTQSDSAKADSSGLRFETPEVFRMPVTIRVGTAGGDVVQRAQLDQREQTIDIPGVASAPTMVVFDDGNHILKTLSFPQPTRWLATQLDRDAGLWDREWVITQLGGKHEDGEAGAALARAADSADYFLTRQQAAAALGAFPSAVALPALQAAIRDTSAQVRAAAVESLGALGDPAALATVRAAWSGDPSYAVRAAAVGALVQLDGANARAIIASALGTPSYQDVIHNAALTGIVRTRDTSFVDTLGRSIGADQSTSYVLAALARAGSQHARDVLVRALDDDRAYVREWALGAIAAALPPATAIQTLQAAAPTLRHEDTKKQVEAVIDQLRKRSGGD